MRIIVFLVMLAVCQLAESQRKKKHNQEVRFRAEASTESGSISSDKPTTTVDVGISGETLSSKLSESTVKHREDDLSSSCSPCVGVDRKGSHLSTALKHFWKKSFGLSDDCLCNHFHSKQDDALGKALSISLNGIPNFRRKTKMVQLAKGDQRNTIKNWDILGPINVGKLELDGDPTFDLFEGAGSLVANPIEYLLAMDDNSTVFTELAPEARVSWRKYSAKANGQVGSPCIPSSSTASPSPFRTVGFFSCRWTYTTISRGMKSLKDCRPLLFTSGKVGHVRLPLLPPPDRIL